MSNLENEVLGFTSQPMTILHDGAIVFDLKM